MYFIEKSTVKLAIRPPSLRRATSWINGEKLRELFSKELEAPFPTFPILVRKAVAEHA